MLTTTALKVTQSKQCRQVRKSRGRGCSWLPARNRLKHFSIRYSYPSYCHLVRAHPHALPLSRRMQIAVSPETSSGGHKFKFSALTVRVEYFTAAQPSNRRSAFGA